MAENTNGAVSRKLSDAFKVQEAQGLPKQIANAISPVVDVTPNPTDYVQKSFFGTRTTTGTGTIVTLDADKDFYLTGLTFFIQCDAAADSNDYSVRATMQGLAQRLIQIQKISLTATTLVMNRDFATPVKCDRGTTITMVQSFTLGVSSISLSVQGFFEK